LLTHSQKAKDPDAIHPATFVTGLRYVYWVQGGWPFIARSTDTCGETQEILML